MQVMIQPFPAHFLIQRAVSVASVPLLKFSILSALCFSHYSQMVKNPPAKWEIWVQSLGWADPLEKGMATHSSVLVWRIPWTESLVGYSPWGCKKLNTTERLTHVWSFDL